MARKCTAAVPDSVHEIRPNNVYFLDDLRRHLRFGRDTLCRERRSGRLRVAERCGRLVVLGQWLLDWIRAVEVAEKGEEG